MQPGTAYKASIGWGAPAPPTDSFGRQLGIDPTGGTDANSPNVVWGPMHWGDARGLNYPPPDVNVDVSAVAQAPTITVFVKVDHNRAVPNSMIFLDAVSLFVDPVQPPPTTIPPTAIPSTATSLPKPAARLAPAKTAMPTVTATPTATMTATVDAYPDSDVHADDHANADRHLHADGYANVNAAAAAKSHAGRGDCCRNRCRPSRRAGIPCHTLRRHRGAELRGPAGHRAGRAQAAVSSTQRSAQRLMMD